MSDSMTMNAKREIAYRLDPTLWAQAISGITLQEWQAQFLRAQRGASILVLTARQVGKTTVAAWGMAHTAILQPGSLSVVACPRQQQSAEAIRKVREMVLKAGAKLVTDNVYGIELANGSRVLALPGSDESIRGLTVDGWILVDEAARVPKELVDALRPMRARCPHTRLVMLSTAWSRTDQFWSAWVSDDPSWLRLQATVDKYPDLLPADFLERERRQGEDYYNREYLGIPSGGHMSPFTWDLYDRAIQVHVPMVPPGQAFRPPHERAVPIANPFQHLKSVGGSQ
jgi:terminase large subunit-like protein